MSWSGSNLKSLLQNSYHITDFASKIGVSRQTVNDWINGQVPKGNHLLSICKTLGVAPDSFFQTSEDENSIIVPAHRTRRRAKITDKTQADAHALIEDYKFFFKGINNSGLFPVLRVKKKDDKNSIKIAEKLRADADAEKYLPIDYYKTFTLMEKMGIFLIIKEFPSTIKSYAFYTKLYNNRVVFVNKNTNVIDLIFPLLHEIIHAIQDATNSYDDTEEDFCDTVASYIQFTDEYIRFIYDEIKDVSDFAKINTLKRFARKHSHSLFGIIKRIKVIDPTFDLNVGGADTNLKKQFSTLGDILEATDNARDYIELLNDFSPLFIKNLAIQVDSISDRKLLSIIDLESVIDVHQIKKELRNLETKE